MRGCLLYALRNCCKSVRGRVYSLHARPVRHPLYARHHSSDGDVFRQIFIKQEYGPLQKLSNVGLVIDCGANVGYSSAYFLSTFPACSVIAVEPDHGNFAMLRRNLSVNRERVTLYRAAIWSHPASLTFSQDAFRDDQQWARQVRTCGPDEKMDIEGVSITMLLDASGFDRISLLKIDIEGAEVVLFRDHVDWLDKVDAIAIELHDDTHFGNASDVFFTAIRGRGFEIERSGELTICHRIAATKNEGVGG
ncbi:MAG: FkbM family methyltransferase [Pirellulales bacterium]|jgi:FkbM family methyltransferase|nr:FkbM family methyltransferase [Pirellulales bacterium]HJN66552.1 FkbM family methyltransferase [Pirellulales bacterium]